MSFILWGSLSSFFPHLWKRAQDFHQIQGLHTQLMKGIVESHIAGPHGPSELCGWQHLDLQSCSSFGLSSLTARDRQVGEGQRRVADLHGWGQERRNAELVEPVDECVQPSVSCPDFHLSDPAPACSLWSFSWMTTHVVHHSAAACSPSLSFLFLILTIDFLCTDLNNSLSYAVHLVNGCLWATGL